MRDHLAHDAWAGPRREARRARPSASRRAPAPRRRPWAVYTMSSSGKCVKTWVTTPGMRRHFGFARAEPRGDRQRRARFEIVRPFGGRHLGHAAEQPLRRPRAHEHEAIGARTTNAAPRRRRPSFFGALIGNLSGSPRRRAAQASIHGQSAQAGFFGVQMVAPRSISACAKSPARFAGTRPSASRRICAFAAGSSSSTAKSLATTRSTLPSTAAAGRRKRSPRSLPRYRADARKRGAARLAGAETSAVALHHRLGASMEISCARVIAEPRPEPEHVIERRRRERPYIGQRAVKRAK